ncbi:LysR substrate-binding domain-containing protein [Salipiger sp. HF18]|uniref:LysR substrate-binding domain-containing protein n=1 Tax=Salipiger sp. HF18 TaxID=2721557 RepID=UPI001C378EC5|nr:LysR substrate-binding domain-containing protein [Salipiger sp. HF18]
MQHIQALNPVFLPREVARYREEHPGVTFSIRTRDRARAEQELRAFAADLALVFEPARLVDFEVIEATEQPVCAVLAGPHPLAGREVLRLRDCLAGPHVIPSPEYGVRHLLAQATKVRSISLRPVEEADSIDLMRQYVLYEQAVCFQIPIGIPGNARLRSRAAPSERVPSRGRCGRWPSPAAGGTHRTLSGAFARNGRPDMH